MEEVLFGHYMTTINDAFERELTQEDEGYESGSESLSIPTPLRRASRIYHISMSENISFGPTTPLTTTAQHPDHTPGSHSSVCCHLSFSSSDEESTTPDNRPPLRRAEHHMDYQHPLTLNTDNSFHDITSDEEEDFPSHTQ